MNFLHEHSSVKVYYIDGVTVRYAASYPVIKLSGNSGIVNIKVKKYKMAPRLKEDITDLMKASIYNDIKKAKELIAAGVDINAQDCYGWTALKYAVMSKNIEIIELLKQHGAIE